ncbi:hypothetical protein VTN31DRAFT_3099 [Thermomyces dupontii]|uniref:uncharacterized protein n=1 Tax=Talaromyces thermophilus TaxID=28565 RepID=UPI003743B557
MVSPTVQRLAVASYRSAFGPKYDIPRHFHGLTLSKVARYGSIVAPLGASIGFVALYFVGEVPRVRRDVWARVLPFLSGYFDRSIPPEDNPF